MRGSPPLHLVLFAVGFALLAVPLAQLTFARPAIIAAAAPKDATGKTPTTIVLRFAHPPSSVSLRHNGIELLSVSDAAPGASKVRVRVPLALPVEGIELVVTAKWPQGTPDTAVTVELEPDNFDPQSQTRWSSGPEINEIVSYQWKS